MIKLNVAFIGSIVGSFYNDSFFWIPEKRMTPATCYLYIHRKDKEELKKYIDMTNVNSHIWTLTEINEEEYTYLLLKYEVRK